MAAVKMEFKFKLDPDTCRRLITHSVLKCTEFTGNSKVPLDLKPKERDLNLRFARNHRNPPQRLVYKSLHFLNHTKTRQAQSQKAPSSACAHMDPLCLLVPDLASSQAHMAASSMPIS